MKHNQLIFKIKKFKILFIIFLGLFLRLYKFKEAFIFGPEQAISLWPIVKLFEEKKLTLIGVHLANYKSALFRPPFFLYLFALPLKIFKFNPLSLGVLFIFLSLGVIFLVFLSAKKAFGEKTGLIASFWYAVSFYLINSDRNVWIYTPIFLTSALILFLLISILELGEKSRRFLFFLTGCLVGLSFSFHFQIIISLLTLSIFFWNFKKVKLFWFLSGVILFLSPLIVFNFRHHFIMINGVKNLLFGQGIIINQGQGFFYRANNGLKVFTDLCLSLFNFQPYKFSLSFNLMVFFIFFFFPSFYLYQHSPEKIAKKIIIFYWYSIVLALLAFIIVNQDYYPSNSFYLWFLIPLLMVIWGNFVTLILTKKGAIGKLIILLIMGANFYYFLLQKPSNYLQKLAVVDYTLMNIKKNAKENRPGVKFINKDVLEYDYLFYYRAPFHNLKFSDINLVEQWQKGSANFFIIYGDYDWHEDPYQVLPYQKINNFGDVKAVIK